MSTRCLICKKLPDGNVRGIYCHHDGNLRWVGRTLLDCYTDEKKIDALQIRLQRFNSASHLQ